MRSTTKSKANKMPITPADCLRMPPKLAPASGKKAKTFIVPVFQTAAPKKGKTAKSAENNWRLNSYSLEKLAAITAQSLDVLENQLSDATRLAEFPNSPGELYELHMENSRIWLITLPEMNDDGGFNALRSAAAKVHDKARVARVEHLRMTLTEASEAASTLEQQDFDFRCGQALAEGLALRSFHYKFNENTSPLKDKVAPACVWVQADTSADWRKGFKKGLLIAEATNHARQLAATPANVANPAFIVEYAKAIAPEVGLKCKVIDHKKAAQLGMGGLVAVGQAGSTPPALISLEWPGSAAASKQPPILIVGKCITFDTGGYSMKPGNAMITMKYDKCGGMAVLGIMEAIAKLKLKRRVIGLVAAAENMVDSAAYRPGDIITHYNGITTEVTNTDAEGRLVLADALSWGCKTYKPSQVIDLATLTGGVVVALGSFCSGFFSTDDELAESLLEAAETSGEKLWRLPIWKQHQEMMRSKHADLANSSLTVGREAHPIQGAAFLSFFATRDGDPTEFGSIPWAHLDIAAMANTGKDDGLNEEGPTGFGVRLITEWLEE